MYLLLNVILNTFTVLIHIKNALIVSFGTIKLTHFMHYVVYVTDYNMVDIFNKFVYWANVNFYNFFLIMCYTLYILFAPGLLFNYLAWKILHTVCGP